MDTPPPDWDPGDLEALDASSRALTRTIDGLRADDLAAPSLLPGWSRAHVVAHVALVGHALAAAVNGLVHGTPVAMYESDEQRDAGIEELAAASPSELRDQHLAAVTAFADAIELMDDSHWGGELSRLPDGPRWPIVTVVPTRRREVEVHHADLGTSYSRADWPEDFVVDLLDTTSVDQAPSGPFRVRATDLGRDWAVGGEGDLTVMGAAADLGWWLIGRGDSGRLSCDGPGLPDLGPWRRASAVAGPDP